jgi:hypothetical protein
VVTLGGTDASTLETGFCMDNHRLVAVNDLRSLTDLHRNFEGRLEKTREDCCSLDVAGSALIPRIITNTMVVIRCNFIIVRIEMLWLSLATFQP